MPRRRPVYLNLLQIKLPPPAIISIMHRIGGALLFLAIPLLLKILEGSLSSAADFDALHAGAASPLIDLVLLPFVWFFWEHFFNGLRHLALDMHWGLSRQTARKTAWLVIVATVVCTVLTEIALW